MEIDDKIYLIFIFSIVLVFNHDFFHVLILPASELQTQQLMTSQISLHKIFNILVLVLYSKNYVKINSPTNSFWYDFM